MILAIDTDKTYTRDPDLWNGLLGAALARTPHFFRERSA